MEHRWIEVDLDKLAHNYRLVRSYVKQPVKVLAVVKADAYGHGLVACGKQFADGGADYLGVTEVGEGVCLRENGIHTPILIFSPFLMDQLSLVVAHSLTITVANLPALAQIGQSGHEVCVHIKLETGLGRTGIQIDELMAVLELLGKYPNIKVEGVYTHFATAMWKEKDFVTQQFTAFERGVQILQAAGMKHLIRHVANSAATMKYPEYHLDMVRVGTILYGQDGSGYKGQLGASLQDSWALKADVIAIQQLPKGHAVGYERTFITKRPTRVAILPIGYYHGFGVEPVIHAKKLADLVKIIAKDVLRFMKHPRMSIYANYKGKKLPVIGKIGMQLTMVDITDCPEIQVGHTVGLPARRTNMKDMVEKRFIHKR